MTFGPLPLRIGLGLVLALAIAVTLGLAGTACTPGPSSSPPPSPPSPPSPSSQSSPSPSPSSPSSSAAGGVIAPAADTEEPGVLAPRPGATPDVAATIPALATRRARLEAALLARSPVMPLDEPLAELQSTAQALAIHDPRVVELAHDSATGAPLRAEVLGVRRAGPSDMTDAAAPCTRSPCYRVEMYNHAANAAIVALVDVAGERVITVDEYPGAQPDIPPHLVALAQAIAAGSPEVARALGRQPDATEAVMAGSKTALNRTRCERSRHLCVAPTFLRGDRALWAIVDLTDGRLVGTRWTSLGKSGGLGPVVTERRLQDEVVSARYCDAETVLERGDWSMRYIITSSDGLRVSDVSYAGRPVLDDAKLVDWHVSYSGDDAYGYSDAIGCPTFSQAAVVARGGPEVQDIVEGESDDGESESDGEGEGEGEGERDDGDGDGDGDVDGEDDDGEGGEGGTAVGFSLTQDFMGEGWPAPCHYFYRQRFDFYADGRFRIVAGNLGRGCGTQGTYRPVLRIALAGDENTFGSWDGQAWRDWDTEAFARQADVPEGAPDGRSFRFADPSGAGFSVIPGSGQFADGGRGDDALLYVTLRKAAVDEGQADLVTIGSCCNTDHRQGPERYIEPAPEPITAAPLVLWYVARLENDDTPGSEYCWADSVLEDGVYVPKAYPCFAGPMFVPFER